jgi:hypothetical protein
METFVFDWGIRILLAQSQPVRLAKAAEYRKRQAEYITRNQALQMPSTRLNIFDCDDSFTVKNFPEINTTVLRDFCISHDGQP